MGTLNPFLKIRLFNTCKPCLFSSIHIEDSPNINEKEVEANSIAVRVSQMLKLIKAQNGCGCGCGYGWLKNYNHYVVCSKFWREKCLTDVPNSLTVSGSEDA